jgi:hypothetical protein
VTPLLEDGDRRLALAIAGIGAASFVSLALLYTVGEPFGTLNDVGNAALGVLAAGFAYRSRNRPAWRPTTRSAAVGAAALGTGIVAIGSALVISKATGWFLAGQVSTLGYAFIGLWLGTLGAVLRNDERLPRRAGEVALAAGVLMAFGFASLPAIAGRYDDVGTAPAWTWIGSVAWLGILLFLLWCGWVARLPAPQLAANEQPAS